jgi:uncharacterized membrane protein
MNARAARTQRFVLASWILLATCVAAWPIAGVGIGWITASLAFVPLLLPLHGICRSSRKALRAAPMALAPALALAITESLVNPPARAIAGASLALVLAAFAALVAALRTAPRD